MNEIVYLNGSFVPLSDAKISVTDYGFLFGYTLYETTRVYGGKIFRLNEHLERLKQACEKVAIPADIQGYKKAILETITRNPMPNGRMRLTTSLGAGSPALDVKSCQSPTVFIYVVPYHPFAAEVYEKGLNVTISRFRRNSQSWVPSLKAAFFMESILAKNQAKEMGFDEALLLNDKGLVAEASSSNVFVVSGGVLKTPKLGNGLLPGITRQVVLELTARLGLKYAETDIWPSELSSAEEVFISNSMLEIMPVTRIEGKAAGTGHPGQITRCLMTAYNELVKQELG